MKRKIAIVLVIALLSTGLVYAASVNGTFAGLPIVNVKVNGETLKTEVPGVVLQGKTLLPARAIAENLGAVVSWDQTTMTASINKPEVDMLFVSDLKENTDGYWDLIAPYTYVSVGQDTEVSVFYQVGPMTKQVYEFRIVVKEPNGDALSSSSDDSFEIGSTGMDGYLTFTDLDFKKPGNFVFEFQIKYDGEYKTVGHKVLVVE